MMLEVRLLGEFEIRGPNGVVHILARKPRALLFHLAERAGRPQQREHLARLLWGDISSDTHARRSLRQALSVLRRELPDGALVARREHVTLDAARVDVDVRQFERLSGSADAQALRQAAALYRGDFLEGFASGADPFDDWLTSTRQRLREQAIAALGRLLSLQRQAGDAAAATTTAIRCLSLDPLREEFHRALMLVYVDQGRLGDALEQFEQCRRLLARELGVAPSLATRELIRELRSRAPHPSPQRAAAELAPTSATPQLRLVAVLAAHRHELPAPGEPSPACFERLSQAVLDQGGEILRRSESALVAVFGAATTRGTEPLRALRAAREGLTCGLAVKAIGVGVSYGELMVAQDGERREVVGDALARAAHLAAQTDAGGVLASDSLQRAVRDRPGTALAFEAARLRSGERSWRVGFVPSAGQRALPFVGRQRELALLRAALDSCRQQDRGEAIIIRGEAGIGKTRLLDRALELALSHGYDVHHACATDFGTHRQRDIVAALTRSALGCATAETDGAARALAFFGERDGRHALALLGDASAPSLGESSDAAERKARLARRQQLWRQLWNSRLSAGPTLVAVEDLHWVPAADRAFLAELGALSSQGPLLLVATSRPDLVEGDADWQGALRGRAVTTLDLGPLSELEAKELALLLGTVADEHVQGAIARSEGHPLFFEQLLRAEPGATLPESVQAVVQSRLDRLEPADAETLRTASVLGQHFEPEPLEALLGRGARLSTLIGEGLLRSSGGRLGFSHALVRDAVYSTLLESRRRDLHRGAAALTADADPVLCAEHWERAEDARAGQAWLRAARAAAASDRLREAVQHCERGLEWAADTDCRFELSLARAQLLGRSASPERAESAAREALTLASNQRQRSRAWLALAEALRGTLRDDGALSALDMAEQLTPEADHESRSHLHYLRGSVLFPRALGRESLECHLKAASHARQAGSVAAQARAQSGIGDAYYIQGKFLSARESFERCIELASREGLERIAARNRVMVAIVELYQLQLREADRQMREIARSASQSLDLATEALAWASLVLVPPLGSSDFEQDLTRSIEVCERAGRARLAIVSRALLVEARAARTPRAECAAALEAVYERCVGSEQSFCGLPTLGVMLRFADGPERRSALYDEAERLLAQGAFVGHGFFMFGRAALTDCLERGDLERARHYVARLASYNPEEPLLWTRFFCSWASALVDWHSGARGERERAALVAALDWAEGAGLAREAARCARALRA